MEVSLRRIMAVVYDVNKAGTGQLRRHIGGLGGGGGGGGGGERLNKRKKADAKDQRTKVDPGRKTRPVVDIGMD